MPVDGDFGEYVSRYRDADVEELKLRINVTKRSVRPDIADIELSPAYFAPKGFGMPGDRPDLEEEERNRQQELFRRIEEHTDYDISVDDWFYREQFTEDMEGVESPEYAAEERARDIVSELGDSFDIDRSLEGSRIFTA